MRMEVRCCCQPQKLLGWIELPFVPTAPKICLYRSRELPTIGTWVGSGELAPIQDNRVVLPIEDYTDEWGKRLAIKAEGMTADELSNIHGFIRNES